MPQRIVAYVPSYATSTARGAFDIRTITGCQLTHVVYGFAGFQQQKGSWAVNWPEPAHETNPRGSKNNISRLVELKKRWPDLKVLMSVGGWNNSQLKDPATGKSIFSVIVSTDVARASFVSSCINLFIKPGFPGLGRLFDGIDIDWEFPLAAQRNDFLALLQEFRTQLDTAGYVDERKLFLSAASAMSDTEQFGFTTMAPILDWINLMAYNAHAPTAQASNKVTDFNSPLYSGSSSPISEPYPTWDIDSTVKVALAAKVPPEKLVLGVNSWGRSYTGVPNVNSGLYQSWTGEGPGSFKLTGAMTYRDIVLANYPDDSKRFFDLTSQSSYIYDPVKLVWISYDDIRSVDSKGIYAANQKLGGVMIWDISGDTRPTDPTTEDPTSLTAPLLSRMWGRMEPVGSNNKNTISQTSNVAPALCSHSGQLFLAWRDSSTGRINFKASSDDGVHFDFPFELLDSSETSPVLVSHNRLNVKTPPQFGLHFGWQGTGNHQLNFATLRLSLEGGAFGGIKGEVGKITLPTMTSSAPSMASLAGAIFAAWTDQTTNQTIVAFSVDNAKTLQGAMPLLPASTFPPALATLNGGLFIAWIATSTGMVTVAKINVSISASRKVSSIEGIAEPIATGQPSSGAPAICGHNGLLAVACRGPGADADMRLLLSANEGASFSDELSWPDSSDSGPALASHNGLLFIAWHGRGNDKLNIARIQIDKTTEFVAHEAA